MSNKNIQKSSQEAKELPLKKAYSAPTPSHPYLGTFDEAPQFLKDNQHIIEGYRLNHHSATKIVQSLFTIHNQTGNIWTHLIGFIIVFAIIFQGITYEMEQSHVLARMLIKDFMPLSSVSENIAQQKLLCDSRNNIDSEANRLECLKMIKSQEKIITNPDVATWPLMIMLMGGAICLACSATFHLIYPMNEKIFKISKGLDFAGIGMNMAFSPIPAFYYAFYCSPSVSFAYISLIFIAGVTSFVCGLFDWFYKTEYFVIKATVLVSSSAVCVVGLVHLISKQIVYSNYGDQFTIMPALYFFLPTLLSYGLGFYTYARKCPERYKPGKFDICGHSHQIWHIFVFTGVVFTYLGSLLCYELRNRCSTCPSGLQTLF